MAYVDSLEEIGNKKQNLWNGLEMTMNARFAKVNTQIFIKKDLHFYRLVIRNFERKIICPKQKELTFLEKIYFHTYESYFRSK